jgi:hypothetical protein
MPLRGGNYLLAVTGLYSHPQHIINTQPDKSLVLI